MNHPTYPNHKHYLVVDNDVRVSEDAEGYEFFYREWLCSKPHTKSWRMVVEKE